jgi:hypothetical protein
MELFIKETEVAHHFDHDEVVLRIVIAANPFGNFSGQQEFLQYLSHFHQLDSDAFYALAQKLHEIEFYEKQKQALKPIPPFKSGDIYKPGPMVMVGEKGPGDVVPKTIYDNAMVSYGSMFKPGPITWLSDSSVHVQVGDVIAVTGAAGLVNYEVTAVSSTLEGKDAITAKPVKAKTIKPTKVKGKGKPTTFLNPELEVAPDGGWDAALWNAAKFHIEDV